jgi:hypothetical protein
VGDYRVSRLSDIIDPSPLGVDIATSLDGDIAEKGKDIDTISGTDNVINAFVRELITPLGFLARWVYDVDGLKILDEDYGNGVYIQLSEPMTETWIANMVAHVTSVADEQTRIQLRSVDYVVTPETNSISFNVYFKVAQDATEYNLILNPVSGGLMASLNMGEA